MTSTFPRWKGDPEPAFVFELSSRLADRFDITVLSPRAPASKRRETMANLRVIRFPYFLQRRETLAMHGGGILNNLKTNPAAWLLAPFFFVGQLLALVRLLRKKNFDLVHAHWLIPQGFIAVLGRIVTRNRNIPLLCTSHGGDLFALRGPVLHGLKRWVMEHSQGLTVVSRAMKEQVVAMGVSPEKVHVISMGVDLQNLFTPDPTMQRSDNELVFVGRLVEKKGVATLLEAMAEVLKKHPDTRLAIAGSGPLEADLKAQAQRLAMAGKVEFLGMVAQSRLPELYNRAVLAVFPFMVAKSGDQEGFGLVQVEAMGCACPVIAGDLPVIHDTVEQEKNGLLVPPGDPQALAQAIIRMLDDPILRNRLATEGHKRMVEQFDWEIVAGRYGAVVSHLIGSRNAPHLST